MNVLDEILKEIPAETDKFIEHSMDISYMIREYMDEKKINQKQLAQKLKKKESEISKWLSGTHNFTIATISKIEADLNFEIIPFVKIGFRKKEERANSPN